jgi:hypothetical protein
MESAFKSFAECVRYWKLAVQYTAGSFFGEPSKMPGLSFNIPASLCKVGAILRERKGSVCEHCYARKGRYVFPGVQHAMNARLAFTRHPLFVQAMVSLLSTAQRQCKGFVPFFRFHDSGDIQSREHGNAIVDIARSLPSISFWLPTKEYSHARGIEKIAPVNLCVRVSNAMVEHDSFNSKLLSRDSYPNQSTVWKRGFVRELVDGEVFCPAPKNDGKCGDCRACWNRDVFRIVYREH